MTSYKNSDVGPAIMAGSPPSSIVPKLDWDRPPWNRWAFQHMREILPTAEVWRGGGAVRDFPRRDIDLDDLAVAGVDGEASMLAKVLDDTYTDGFLVIKMAQLSMSATSMVWTGARCICRSLWQNHSQVRWPV